MNLKDVMSPDVREELGVQRRHALSLIRSVRAGSDVEKVAKTLADIYEHHVLWHVRRCGYGVAHPYCVFGSRLRKTVTILMGKEWVDRHM